MKKVRVVNITEKFDSFHEFWNPKIVGELNGQQVKLAKLKDEFVMHQHDDEDELFLVIEGTLHMEFEEKTLVVNPMEFLIVPKGTLHRPKAIGEVKVLLFEPSGTINTGGLENEFTQKNLENI